LTTSVGEWFYFVKQVHVYRRIKALSESRTVTALLRCRKVEFVYRKRILLVLFISFTDENGMKWYYVSPGNSIVYADTRDIKKYFNGRDINVCCYEGSRMIKSIPPMDNIWRK
ncbi:MAG: hypothetical protein IJY96_06565, partial [Oscillospiraceae bacterium]|nr:hypothetical protein [Oscillospiraceae bacterium]